MCGIAGWFCFGEGRPDPKTLKFLWASQAARGRSASGIAWLVPGKKIVVHKSSDDAIAAVNAQTEEWWDKVAKSPQGLLHARATTKGSEKDNRNNHPVTDGEWFVVHNGHVRNDDELFATLLRTGEERFAEVDTAAIPLVLSRAPGDTMLEKIRSLSLLDGQATVAVWNKDSVGEIALVKVGTNPLHIAYDVHKGIVYWSSVDTTAKVLGSLYQGMLDFFVGREVPDNYGVMLSREKKSLVTFSLERKAFVPTRRWASTAYPLTPRGPLPRPNDAAEVDAEEVVSATIALPMGFQGQYQHRLQGADHTGRVEVVRSVEATFQRGFEARPAHPGVSSIAAVKNMVRFNDPLPRILEGFKRNPQLHAETMPTPLGAWKFTRDGSKVVYHFSPSIALAAWWASSYPKLRPLSELLPVVPNSGDDQLLSTLGVVEEYEWRAYSTPTYYGTTRLVVCPFCGLTTTMQVFLGTNSRCPMCSVLLRRVA